MKVFSERMSSRLDNISHIVGQAIAWLTLLMVVTTTCIVVLRYGFDLGWIWLQESVIYFHVFVIAIATGHILLKDEHVRVDIVYRRQPQKVKSKINLVGHVIFLLPTCVFIFMMSWDYVIQSWQVQEGSQEAGGLPFLYLLKTCLLLMPLLLLMQGISESFKEMIIISNKKETQ